MRKLSFILSTLFLLFSIADAQTDEPKEVQSKMSKGSHTGWQILVKEVDQKELEDYWKKAMKDHDSKLDKVKKSDDMVSEEASFPEISEAPVNIYVQFKEGDGGTYMTTFVELVDDVFLSPDLKKEESKKWAEFVKNFARETSVDKLKNVIDDSEKTLKDQEKDLKKLEKDKEGYEKDIENAKETIENRKKDIEKNGKDQEKKKSEISEQKKALEALKKKLGKY